MADLAAGSVPGGSTYGSRWPAHLPFASVSIGLALCALAGWWLGLPILTTLVDGRPALSPMTAVLMLLAAAAALALRPRPATAGLLALCAAASGLGIVLAHALDVPSSSGLRPQWWSSSLTGMLFALSGCAGTMLAHNRVAGGQLVAFGVLMFAGLVGLGHVFPTADLYSLMPGTGVAIPTVLGFVSLSAAQLLARADAGVVGALSSRYVVGLLGRLLLLAGAACVLLVTTAVLLAGRASAFDGETAVLLVAWSAVAVLWGTLWALAVAVERADAARMQAERERDSMRQLVAAAVTHDLRSPLQTAVISASLLQRLVTEPQALAAVARLQRSNRRLDRLLRSLLDTLALDGGKAPTLKATPVDLHALVAEVVAENEAALADRVAWDGAASGCWDRDALFRVVENLLLNAVKYGEPASPIWCRIGETSDGQVELTVENLGRPIEAADQAQIFEPFARGHGASQQGWGIGLAFARSVARGHGGDLRLQRSDADGTAFALRLPSDARPHMQPVGAR